jgi:hypothetical protein
MQRAIRVPFFAMAKYWLTVVKAAFWKSLLVFFDDPTKGIGLFVLCTIVTTVIVWTIRSKEAFAEHWKSNIAIPISGGVGSWILVFAYFLVAVPSANDEELRAQLSKTVSDVRSAIVARNGAEDRALKIEEQQTAVKFVHGACRMTEDQLNPIRSQQPCPNAPPPTLRDRVLAINARLTEGDRNRFSNALSEFQQSLDEGQTIFNKLSNEDVKLEHARRDGSIAQDFAIRQKELTDLANEGWKYQRDFPQLRLKWQQLFGDQVAYVFGDNPDNDGPNALINAAEGYRNHLNYWKAIQNKNNASVLTLLSYANNDFQSFMRRYSDWHSGCRSRLTEMRKSIR